jgi:hypothetical protein
LGLSLILTLLIGQLPGAQEVDWPEAWVRLAGARAAAVDSPERAAALVGLDELARAEAATARGALLHTHLDRLRGGDAVLQVPGATMGTWPFEGAENWLAAEVLGGGPMRARAAREALEAGGGAISPERVRMAWEIGVAEARALRLDAARGLQAALHQRFLATWSAMDLALTETKLGAYERADAVLAEQIVREVQAGQATGELWARRGTLTLGSGDELRARDYLGFGRAQGSLDAGVILAKLDLDRGRLPEALAGFRALLLDDDPSPWARRGWGLALLPDGNDRPRRDGD